ncbi:hypothetical protein [Parafrankia sp. EUN1f]|uniref:hypothetical protein n=1 Tax=Parafrankia sp. EUN1f TaxID=102897 RepID=UPI0001C4390C|nr:hypothetical protein [Parafrankia sp. EUN1f]EFC86240.1 hypothetical protein FrEUN1fDRAFT_0677 [Parafrankia sp. EUN1f]
MERESSFTRSQAGGLVSGHLVRADRGLCAVVAQIGPVVPAVVPPAVTGNRLAVWRSGGLAVWLPVRLAPAAVLSATVVEALDD